MAEYVIERAIVFPLNNGVNAWRLHVNALEYLLYILWHQQLVFQQWIKQSHNGLLTPTIHHIVQD